MKRIALLIPSLKSGGAERVVSIWSSEIAKTGQEVFLIVLYKTESEYETYGNVKKIYLYESHAESKKDSILGKIRKIRNALKGNKIDVAIPFITYIGLMTTAACAFTKTVVVETIRNNPESIPKSKIERTLRNISVFFSKKCIVQNESQKQYFGKRIQKKTVIFPNPLHPSVTSAEKEYKNTGKLTFVTVGRLETQKNQKLLCDAFALASKSIQNIELKIYGAGSLQGDIEQHIEDLNMQGKIFLCGKTDNVADTLIMADAFILSSDFEGMPNALMEAMAVGLPCISTDCPTGPSDMIETRKNGILVPVGDVVSMSKAIINIAKNYAQAADMGRMARKFALEHYEASSSARKLTELVNQI